jgi:hypothetical protein
MQPIIDKKNKNNKEINLLNSNIKKQYFKQITFDDKKLTEKDLNFIYAKFNENYEMIERDTNFESNKDKELLIQYYTNKYQTQAKLSLMYILFILSVIFTVILSNYSPWVYDFRNIINDSLKYNGQLWKIEDISKK